MSKIPYCKIHSSVTEQVRRSDSAALATTMTLLTINKLPLLLLLLLPLSSPPSCRLFSHYLPASATLMQRLKSSIFSHVNCPRLVMEWFFIFGLRKMGRLLLSRPSRAFAAAALVCSRYGPSRACVALRASPTLTSHGVLP